MSTRMYFARSSSRPPAFHAIAIGLAGQILMIVGCATNDSVMNSTDREQAVPTVTSRESTDAESVPELAPVRLNVESFVAGYSVEGRLIDCTVIGDKNVSASIDTSTTHDIERILIISGIHGDEPAGNDLVRRLIAEIQRQPDIARRRTIVLMPDVNPDATAHHQRSNVNGVDINRNFTAKNWRPSSRRSATHGPNPLSEPETQVIAEIIERYRPTRIVSMHQPVSCIDYDGPEPETRLLAEAMSEAIDGRLPVRRLGARPGSLGSFAGNDRAIPTITVEFPHNAHRSGLKERWVEFSPMLVSAIRWSMWESSPHAK